jgi:hypothetical protein
MTELAAVGATGQYLAGATGAIPLWATLNQAAVAGLTTADGPTFDHLHITNNIEFPDGSASILHKLVNSAQNIIGCSRTDNSWDHYLQYSGWASFIFTGGLGIGGYDPGQTDNLLVNGKIGVNDISPSEYIDVDGNINVTGVYKVDDVQVLSNRVIDARCDDAINSGDATTDGVIDSLRDAMIAHGLIAAA